MPVTRAVVLGLATLVVGPTLAIAADGTADRDENCCSVTVRPLLPNGAPAHLAYLTLWRALEPGEKDPVNTVNGPKGFGYYNPVIWDDRPSDARWVRARSAHPNNGRHGWEEAAFRFGELSPGKYRVTAASYHPGDKRPDPTPYGASAPFALGPNDETSRSIEIRLTGSAPLVLRCLDAESKQPILGLAIRLRDADGTPIVHGHGSGNFFERTSDIGEVIYNQLRPGDYTVQVLGKQAQVNDFVQYEPMKEWMPVHVEAAGPTNAEILVPPRAIDEEEIEQRFPFYVYGLVTDEQGNPLAGVEVHAATGMGTLLGGGRTRTDADGRYRLYFGPGIRTRINKELAPLGVGLQAALISARHEGRFETNFNRQGEFCMSDQAPERLEQEIKKKGQLWGKTSLDQFVLPGRPREVNFTLAPAATLRGTLRWESRELKEKQLYLTGDELPPGSNVLKTLTTDRKGGFELDSVPIGKPWRFGMRIEGTFYKIETEPFTLDNPGTHRCELMLDTKPTSDGAVTLRLRYRE